MPPLTQTTTETASTFGTLHLRGDHVQPTPQEDWKETLDREGWVVVKGVIPKEKALAYADKAYEFVESFGLGFDRNDPKTYVPEKRPYFYKGGLYHKYGASHEQFVWDIKQDPAIVEKFAKVWGTDELIASYGIMNLLPNGPEDGGLMILKGSKALYKELFEAFDDVKPERGWNKNDRHDHTPEQIQWLIDHGCEYHKVCAEPGDLLLWDSRTIHYGATPSADRSRIATYVCYKPASMITPEIKAKRDKARREKLLTSHDPVTFTCEARQPPESHPTRDHPKVTQLQEPVLTDLGKRLAGVESW
ncbi:hypothetical protein IAT40_002177 [Kwoniella sp. CBS 6097]